MLLFSSFIYRQPMVREKQINCIGNAGAKTTLRAFCTLSGFHGLLSTLGSLAETTNCCNVGSVLKADNYQKMTSEQSQPHKVVV